MKQGFMKVAAATPAIKVADCVYNTEQIIELIKKCTSEGVRLVVFPELCITGYTCGDLFFQTTLLRQAEKGLEKITKATKGKQVVVVVGLPFMVENKLYNVAAVMYEGELLGMIPKSNIPNYSEFYEARHFEKGNEEPITISVNGKDVLFGTNILFSCREMPEFTLGVEICEDVWVPIPPSSRHALAGATVIANPSASDETTGKDSYRRELIGNQSARLISGYVYSNAGEGESTTDLVYTGHNLIYENGTMIAESERFQTENFMVVSEIDLDRLVSERRRMSTYHCELNNDYQKVMFSMKKDDTTLTRFVSKHPFVPSDKKQREKRCEEILNIQAAGLKKRLKHTNCKTAVIGISGGLDSTLALLVMAKAYDQLGLDRKDIIAVTMPCFGTTDRTYKNAVSLTKQMGATLLEIPINEAVLIHLRDIDHDVNVHDVTYENAQARQRTMILMNTANKYNGMVIGTGDMSELALGWATYNGDHMSMYGVNCSVPKTLVRYLVEYYATTTNDSKIHDILFDVLDTPVSPELLPPEDGVISQKTEDIVGPYELHDFFLYYIMRFGYSPRKIFHLAVYAYNGDYDEATIYKWLKKFYWRFFSQQFKRSCLPDGPKVGSVALSPRGDWRMPSDACVRIWIDEIEQFDPANK
ncbi:NAD synthetase [Lachnospiraceae bacterium KM106-2]|nr:NAD synthetase [Lachnospiraceae bacterium KM106-2]